MCPKEGLLLDPNHLENNFSLCLRFQHNFEQLQSCTLSRPIPALTKSKISILASTILHTQTEIHRKVNVFDVVKSLHFFLQHFTWHSFEPLTNALDAGLDNMSQFRFVTDLISNNYDSFPLSCRNGLAPY